MWKPGALALGPGQDAAGMLGEVTVRGPGSAAGGPGRRVTPVPLPDSAVSRPLGWEGPWQVAVGSGSGWLCVGSGVGGEDMETVWTTLTTRDQEREERLCRGSGDSGPGRELF